MTLASVTLTEINPYNTVLFCKHKIQIVAFKFYLFITLYGSMTHQVNGITHNNHMHVRIETGHSLTIAVKTSHDI